MGDLHQRLTDLPEDFPNLNGLSSEILYLLGCRSFDQFCLTFKGLLDPSKFCPFCNKSEDDPACLSREADWILIRNDFPVEGMRSQLLVIPRRHETDVAKLSGTDWTQIGRLVAHAVKAEELPGGGLVMRFGSPLHHAGTVPHLHLNIISPTGEREYRIPLSKEREDRVKNYSRLLDHRKQLEQAGGLSWLLQS